MPAKPPSRSRSERSRSAVSPERYRYSRTGECEGDELEVLALLEALGAPKPPRTNTGPRRVVPPVVWGESRQAALLGACREGKGEPGVVPPIFGRLGVLCGPAGRLRAAPRQGGSSGVEANAGALGNEPEARGTDPRGTLPGDPAASLRRLATRGEPVAGGCALSPPPPMGRGRTPAAWYAWSSAEPFESRLDDGVGCDEGGREGPALGEAGVAVGPKLPAMRLSMSSTWVRVSGTLAPDTPLPLPLPIAGDLPPDPGVAAVVVTAGLPDWGMLDDDARGASEGGGVQESSARRNACTSSLSGGASSRLCRRPDSRVLGRLARATLDGRP
jgi:hypothetical protein